jgi:hypothetical protein
MKNSKLKSLMSQKLALSTKDLNEVSVLNGEELIYALGGASAGGPCPMLTSCGTYSTCGLKIKLAL